MLINGVERAIKPDTDLSGADLSGANLSGADLSRANLSEANLREANLSWANLSRANLNETILPNFLIVPEVGDFIGFKTVENIVLKIKIPNDAKRTSSLVGRKCRAEYVDVLEVLTKTEQTEFHSINNCIYRVGQRIYPDKYDDDIRVECTHGIHFFLTRQEAEEF